LIYTAGLVASPHNHLQAILDGAPEYEVLADCQEQLAALEYQGRARN